MMWRRRKALTAGTAIALFQFVLVPSGQAAQGHGWNGRVISPFGDATGDKTAGPVDLAGFGQEVDDPSLVEKQIPDYSIRFSSDPSPGALGGPIGGMLFDAAGDLGHFEVGYADPARVPEPATLFLLVVGAALSTPRPRRIRGSD